MRIYRARALWSNGLAATVHHQASIDLQLLECSFGVSRSQPHGRLGLHEVMQELAQIAMIP